MQRKAIYFDVETTGLNPWRNDIIQLAALIEIDGEVADSFYSNIRPVDPSAIDQRALVIHGMREEELLRFPEAKEVYTKFISFLSRYVDRYNTADKLTPIGYNVKFDMDFLSSFFKKMGARYFGSWLNWHYVDVLNSIYEMKFYEEIQVPNCKLTTVCQYFNISLGDSAHDALADIKATRELHLKIRDTR